MISCNTMDAFYSIKTSEKFEKGTHGTVLIFWEIFQKIVELPKERIIQPKILEISKENQKKRKFWVRDLRKFWYTTRGCLFFRKFW